MPTALWVSLKARYLNTLGGRIYRGLEHAGARVQLQQGQHLFSPETRQFAKAFSQLQEARHRADYDHAQTVDVVLSNTWIDRAEEAIRGFMQVSMEERRAVAVHSLIRRRRN